MNILIDINHPAHVHYFKNLYKILTGQGFNIIVVSRNKEIEHALLKAYDIPFITRGKGKSGKVSKFLYMIYADMKLLQLAKKFKIDLFLNFLHPYPSHIAKILGKPSLVFSDTEHAKLHHQLTVPFATKIFTPSCYTIDLGIKQERFDSYMELAYLHPKYFKPDPSILDVLNVKADERFCIVRFVSWVATHDFGHSGISFENKVSVVKQLMKHGKVFISSEGELPTELTQYRINIPVEKMHDAIYYSSLVFGESATMASEAAVLGTPAIFINNSIIGYTTEQEKSYGLVFNYTESPADQDRSIEKAVNIMAHTIKSDFAVRRQKLLEDKIDTTEFMIQQIQKFI